MRTHIILISGFGIVLVALLTRCKSLNNGVEPRKDTIEKVDTWKEKDSLSEIRKNAEIDWEKFKKEAETAIEKGNIQIEELRKEVSKVDNKEHQKLAEELDCLEERKNGLKERLALKNREFKATVSQIDESGRIVAWEFEKGFVRDVNEFLAVLNNLINRIKEKRDN